MLGNEFEKSTKKNTKINDLMLQHVRMHRRFKEIMQEKELKIKE